MIGISSIFGTMFTFVVFFQIIVFVFVWAFVIRSLFRTFKRNSIHSYFKNNVVNNNVSGVKRSNNKYKRVYNDVTKAELKVFNIDDINTLKDYFYDMFIDFETAYNNLDYNIMKMLSTKQLYQNYYTGISLDLKAGKKKIINNIEKNNVIIFELDSTIAKQVASVMIDITYTSYTLDKKGYIVSGSRDERVREKFEVEFRKDFEKEDIVKCPNCGAAVTGNKCDYCRSTIKNVDFKISSIRKIVEDK